MSISAIRMILCCLLLGLCIGAFKGCLDNPQYVTVGDEFIWVDSGTMTWDANPTIIIDTTYMVPAE